MRKHPILSALCGLLVIMLSTNLSQSASIDIDEPKGQMPEGSYYGYGDVTHGPNHNPVIHFVWINEGSGFSYAGDSDGGIWGSPSGVWTTNNPFSLYEGTYNASVSLRDGANGPIIVADSNDGDVVP